MSHARSKPSRLFRGSRESAGPRFPRPRISEPFALALLASVLLLTPRPAAAQGGAEGTFRSREHSFRLVKVLDRLSSPWALAFLPYGGMLITEQGGRLVFAKDGVTEAVSGVPAVNSVGQGGLLDIALSPSFAADRTIYFTYSQPGTGGAGTSLARAVLDGTSLREVRTIWSMERKTGAGQHFGSRIRFLSDGTILLTTGDRGQSSRAQDLSDDAGKVHRIAPDGSVPRDNPFLGSRAARPSVYSYGHRNPQGLAIHPGTREPWITEHGPQGGDEVNIVRPGRNYGWPVVTFGRQYGTGAPIGEGTAKPGMEQPLIHWTPSIAPSGLEFYTGDAFPRWKGSLFSGNLAGRRLVRMTVSDTQVLSQEVLLEGTVGRIRDVRQGPDGFLYILTDESPGAVYRLEPGD